MRFKYLYCGFFCLLLNGCATAPQSAQNNQSAQNDKAAIDDGMVLIPAGEFTMGSDKEENISMWRDANALNPYGFNEQLYINERPVHKVTLPAFRIDKYEVSNTQYRDFVTATQHKIPILWRENAYDANNEILQSLPLDTLRQLATHNVRLDMDVTVLTHEELLSELEKINAVRDTYPVTMVTWFDANDYCLWAGKRMPTEAEWEKAARGPKGFEYPWGNAWDPKKVNTTSNNPDIPYSPVGSYPDDKSFYGVYDMAANVAEWVSDWYMPYPDAPPTEGNNSYGRVERVIRGGMASSGHYDSISVVFRSARRMHLRPTSTLIDLGFRCAKNAE